MALNILPSYFLLSSVGILLKFVFNSSLLSRMCFFFSWPYPVRFHCIFLLLGNTDLILHLSHTILKANCMASVLFLGSTWSYRLLQNPLPSYLWLFTVDIHLNIIFNSLLSSRMHYFFFFHDRILFVGRGITFSEEKGNNPLGAVFYYHIFFITRSIIWDLPIKVIKPASSVIEIR